MPILLFPNRTKDTSLAVTRRTAALLQDAGASLLAPEEFTSELGGLGIVFLPAEKAMAAADLVVTIGGDGTLLRAGTACIAHKKPVLGVNLGRTGFLATCEVAELPQKLPRLVRGDYSLDSRSLLVAECAAHNWRQNAINDVMLFGASRLHPMDYTVYCDDAFVSRYRSDGVIVATPTGSTAYSLSAGGPVLDARAPVMVLTPICAHSLHAAPLVFSATRSLRIVAEEQNRDGIYLCADSQPPCTLRAGESAVIHSAAERLDLITFDSAEQFRAIENKLMGR